MMMMLSASMLCFHSCAAYQLETLQGKYSSGMSVETDKPVDEVWEKVIDYFAMSAAPISLIDKESGLIVSERVICPATIERNGKPFSTGAFVVIPDYYSASGSMAKPRYWSLVATANFNVRIKVTNRKTLIYVNLYGMRVYDSQTNRDWGYGASTGVFEEDLLGLFK